MSLLDLIPNPEVVNPLIALIVESGIQYAKRSGHLPYHCNSDVANLLINTLIIFGSFALLYLDYQANALHNKIKNDEQRKGR
jgi:hypothetical protein